jgi:hypothetical protein
MGRREAVSRISDFSFRSDAGIACDGGMMDVEGNLELIRRTVAAVDELDAFGFMPGYS